MSRTLVTILTVLVIGIILIILFALFSRSLFPQKESTTVIRERETEEITPVPVEPEPDQIPVPVPTEPEPTNPDQPSQRTVIRIQGNSFSPESITIKPGTTVTWINSDLVDHTVTGNFGVDRRLNSGESFTHTFRTSGTYPYGCTLHPNMEGTVLVQN